MLKADAIAFYGTGTAVARALGISKGAVSAWGTKVPPLSAARLAELTQGALKFNPSDYADYYKAGVS